MTRFIENHKVNPANDQLLIRVEDEPGVGGACHQYTIAGPDFSVSLNFQNGPINESGVNGITQEALLAIILDRLEGFQSGPYKCRENAIAITKLQEAFMWLQKRTRDRMARGVEGTHQV